MDSVQNISICIIYAYPHKLYINTIDELSALL
nr:MAG TPA: hypothetical protein [Caudoviricetes sp.]